MKIEFNKIDAFVRLSRPVNVLIGGLSIFMGAFIAGSIEPLDHVILAMISGSLIAAGANAINDFFDVNIDRINKPYRPIPSGRVTKRAAFFFALVCFAIGSCISAFINAYAAAIALCASVILYAYSARLKRTVIWGNLTVSLMTAFAFIYGGIAVDRLNIALIPAIFAFLFHLGREIIKDVQDMHGDASDNARTLPLAHGKRLSLLLVTVIFAILIVITYIPYLLGIFGNFYLYIVSIGVNPVLLYTIGSFWIDSKPVNLGRLSNLLKIDMLIGLIAIYFGRI
ncbi:geranylgeranylglycerol-phosphate geranylgeranyltransferase [candidate division KSB1 bacterium]|nr:geranylgeranylglycerol-phosphate geranylgeranyltransferase [candidate division KSB1 bacterium]